MVGVEGYPFLAVLAVVLLAKCVRIDCRAPGSAQYLAGFIIDDKYFAVMFRWRKVGKPITESDDGTFGGFSPKCVLDLEGFWVHRFDYHVLRYLMSNS